jgi:hypothetical protein
VVVVAWNLLAMYIFPVDLIEDTTSSRTDEVTTCCDSADEHAEFSGRFCPFFNLDC